MKRLILLIILLLSAGIMFCNTCYNIHFDKPANTEEIKIIMIDSLYYFNAFELNKAFHASIREDIDDQRLYVTLYNQQVIFLINSPYLQASSDFYNMTYSLKYHCGKMYIPLTFFQRVFPELFSENFIKQKDFSIYVKTPVDNSIRRIVIDAGHGGKDPGAVGRSTGTKEKKIVLDVARKLKQNLENQLNVEVILTRDTDKFVSLQNRTKMANDTHSDLFISLHCNASRSKKATGIEVFFLSNAKTDEARAVEALENSVVSKYEGGESALKKYDDLSFILMDMEQTEQLRESSDLAVRLQKSLVSVSGLRDRGVKQANFYVLRGAFMPAVLIELGFITNYKEAKLLSSASFQDKLVNAITESIKKYKYKYDFVQ